MQPAMPQASPRPETFGGGGLDTRNVRMGMGSNGEKLLNINEKRHGGMVMVVMMMRLV